MGDDNSDIVLRLTGRADWYDDAHPGTVKTPDLLREAATLITSLREALEEATKLNNKYAWERDKAREERDKAERKAEAFWRPQVERLEVALNPSRKETI
jgi:hypothetical protein